MNDNFYNLEAEAIILGLLMIDFEKYKNYKLIKEDFYKSSHQSIFYVIDTLKEKGKIADLITVADSFKDKIDKIGGRSYLVSLTNSVIAQNFDEYEKILKGLTAKRLEVIKLNKQLKEIDNKELDEYYEDDDIIPIQDVEFKGLSKPITIDLKPVNDLLNGGYREGELHIISGYAKDGKTTYCEWMTSMFTKQSIPVLWISYEMNLNHLQNRFYKAGCLDDILCYVPKKNTSNKIKWIESKIIEGLSKFDTKVVFIDNLDFITSDIVDEKTRNGTQRAVVSMLKRIANERDIIIYLIAHIRKTPEDGREPRTQDISGASEIYKLADGVMFYYRIREKAKRGEPSSIFRKNEVKLIFTEVREGHAGYVNMIYKDNKFSLISNREEN